MNRQNATILTVVTAIVVGCPACGCLFFGISTLLGNTTYTLNNQEQAIDSVYGIPLLCLGLIGILVPVAVWFFTVRGKQA
jgi:hypothetical protein